MSGATIGDFLGYWEVEGEAYFRRGDYEWMASLVPGQRVLEIGCGLGFGTVALLNRGLDVLALDSLPECLEATRQRIPAPDLSRVSMLQAEVTELNDEQRSQIEAFAPDSVVCWLMGAPANITGAQAGDAGKAVAAYREKVHRAVAALAAGVQSVRALHLVDRTAIPWQAKDLGRDTLVRYHADKTLLDLPFRTEKRLALYRKLEDKVVDLSNVRRSHPSLKSVVPALASLVAERKS